MKNKFIVLTLCFSIVFSSINFNNTYAFNDNNLKPLVVDGGVISAPMLAVVSTLALGTGLAIKNIDDIYDLGSNFYNHFKDNWSNVVDTFNKNVIITATGVVTVGSAFLELLKGFLPSQSAPVGVLGYWDGIPIYKSIQDSPPSTFKLNIGSGTVEHYFNVNSNTGSTPYLHFIANTTSKYYRGTINLVHYSSNGYQNVIKSAPDVLEFYGVRGYSRTEIYCTNHDPSSTGIIGRISNEYYDLVDAPSYNDTVIDKNKNENGDLPLYVPGNLSDLPGTSTNDVFVNNGTSIPYNPPVDGVVTLPGIDNPSIDVDTDITFPGVNDVPSDTPFANITEYIIGLVVPSDTYWSDTFGGLHNNFINAFPMVDMSGFNSLVVNGKPFPNIDVKIMGSHGRIVNGDTVNSIVDWLRPIIAGFIFLCLMFFNYRKLYKLIRNSEPFEGIGKVENHAN